MVLLSKPDYYYGVLGRCKTVNERGRAEGELGVRGVHCKNKRMSRRRREIEHGVK